MAYYYNALCLYAPATGKIEEKLLAVLAMKTRIQTDVDWCQAQG